MKEIRIQKFFTDAGLMSRRACENAVMHGRVKVNGETARIGLKIDPENDRVELDGKPVSSLRPEKTYLMLNKPRGYVSTASDEKGRPTVTDLVKDCNVRVYPAGRLDLDSEGLLLLTNDGNFANLLTHPSNGIFKVYEAEICGNLSSDDIDSIRRVREIDGYALRPAEIELLSRGDGKTLLKFTLHEGRNRQIRKMCGKAGFEVTNLKRTAIGMLKLGSLPCGHWKKLDEKYVKKLFGKQNGTS